MHSDLDVLNVLLTDSEHVVFALSYLNPVLPGLSLLEIDVSAKIDVLQCVNLFMRIYVEDQHRDDVLVGKILYLSEHVLGDLEGEAIYTCYLICQVIICCLLHALRGETLLS